MDRVQKLCESRDGHPGPSLISLMVSVDLTAEDIKLHIIIVDVKAIQKRKSL